MSCLVSSENYVFEVMRFRPDSGHLNERVL